MSIAEICGIDLEDQVIKKMEINEKRVYKRINGVLLKVETKEVGYGFHFGTWKAIQNSVRGVWHI